MGADSQMGTAPTESQRTTSRVRAWYDRFQSGRAVLIAWLITRALMLALLALAERFMVGDVFYYHRKIAALTSVGLGKTLNEYLTPVVWILSLPYGATGGTRTGYLIGFIIFMLALDAALACALWRTAGRRRDYGLDFWLFFLFLIGPLCYLRFDMLPAVLAGGALLAARRRPWITGALTGLGAAVKLWPALLFPSFLTHRPDRRGPGPTQPDFRGLDPTHLALDLAVGPGAADRVHLGHTADGGPSGAAHRVDRGLLEIPGLRDLRPRRVTTVAAQQSGDRRRPDRDHCVVRACLPQSAADAGGDRPRRSRHGRDHDDHQQDPESAISPLARWADGSAVDLAQPSNRTGEANAPPARNPASAACRIDPARLPPAVRRSAGLERQGDDRHLHLRHHPPQSRSGGLHRRSVPPMLAAAGARRPEGVEFHPPLISPDMTSQSAAFPDI